MATLPKFDEAAHAIRFLLLGRPQERDKARKLVLGHLRGGTATTEIQTIAADMLDPPKRKRGAPKAVAHEDMFTVGEEVELLNGDGVSYADAYQDVADRRGIGVETVKSWSDSYRAALEQYAAVLREEYPVKG